MEKMGPVHSADGGKKEAMDGEIERDMVLALEAVQREIKASGTITRATADRVTAVLMLARREPEYHILHRSPVA